MRFRAYYRCKVCVDEFGDGLIHSNIVEVVTPDEAPGTSSCPKCSADAPRSAGDSLHQTSRKKAPSELPGNFYCFGCRSNFEWPPEADAPAPETCPICQHADVKLMGYVTKVEMIVKGRERPYKLDATCMPIGWDKGNTNPDVQQRRYERIWADQRKAAVQNDKQAIKGGVRKIATVPRELHRMRTNQYGKDYYETDTKAKLKADGLLFKN